MIPPMPQQLRDYLYTALRVATPVLVIIGLVALWLAVSFEGYITALIFFALSGCSFVGLRELKEEEAKTNPPPMVDSLIARAGGEDGTSVGN
jgi:hypothetical protein